MKFLTLLLVLLFSITANATLRENDKQSLGHPNLLVNPGFENGLSNWTNANGTRAKETTTFFEGKSAYKVTLTAETLDLSQEVTVPKLAGNSFGVSCFVKADLATTTEISLCPLVDSVEAGCTTATATGGEFTKFAANNLIASGGSIGIKIKTEAAAKDSASSKSKFVILRTAVSVDPTPASV